MNESRRSIPMKQVQGGAETETSHEPGNNKRLSSVVVARLMGLESLTDFSSKVETSKIMPPLNEHPSSRLSKNGEEYKQNHGFVSPRVKDQSPRIKKSTMFHLQTHHGTEKPVSIPRLQRIRLRFGRLIAEDESFLKLQRTYTPKFTTTSNTTKRVVDKVVLLASNSKLFSVSSWTLRIFHDLRISFHTNFAISHFTRMGSSVSRSLSQTGHLIESRSIPLLSKLTLVGRILFLVLHIAMLTLMGTSLLHLVGLDCDCEEELVKRYLIPLTVKLLELSNKHSQRSWSFERL
uniref:Protein longifolia 1-like n=1 Tax=Tanacetum cinerariifolium TaxID=118510 RepID=A0A6L2NHX7_TANCI|nr:protein longifolia 1-like [Tanacetum cinerariifolium]